MITFDGDANQPTESVKKKKKKKGREGEKKRKKWCDEGSGGFIKGRNIPILILKNKGSKIRKRKKKEKKKRKKRKRKKDQKKAPSSSFCPFFPSCRTYFWLES